MITTVFNEQATIERLLDSLAMQSRPPDEIVICDGGSRDKTVACIEAYRRQKGDDLPPLRVLVEPGANISRGRNLAIAAANHPLIAVTDAGYGSPLIGWLTCWRLGRALIMQLRNRHWPRPAFSCRTRKGQPQYKWYFSLPCPPQFCRWLRISIRRNFCPAAARSPLPKLPGPPPVAIQSGRITAKISFLI
ncbi:MAG: glycosyltransferase [Caldilineaceae bacterium]